ncbi:hypothetical protein HK104_003189 [Borealophlyctis nickersoniae]|nr:hypothetical protein HK104_003189 [Borealophlyctis nickersoniae]
MLTNIPENTIPPVTTGPPPLITIQTTDLGVSDGPKSPSARRSRARALSPEPMSPSVRLRGRSVSQQRPVVDDGSEVAAYISKIEDERNLLRSQLAEAQSLENESADQARVAKHQELDDARKHLSEVEAQVDALTTEVADLRRDSRVAVKERSDLDERLRKELADIELEKEAFRDRENQLLEQIKAAKRENRDLKSLGAVKEVELQSARNLSDAKSENSAQELQNLLAAKDKQVALLSEQIVQLNQLNNVLTSRITSHAEEIRALKDANRQLSSANQNLMEEAESYQLLLQQQTVNGDFLDSAFMTLTRRQRRGSSFASHKDPGETPGRKSLADELSGTDSKRERTPQEIISELECELQMTSDEVKALSLYISKILSSDRLLSALADPDNAEDGSDRGHRRRSHRKRSALPALSFLRKDNRKEREPKEKETTATEEPKESRGSSEAVATPLSPTTEGERLFSGGPLSPGPWLRRFSFFSGKNDATNDGDAPATPSTPLPATGEGSDAASTLSVPPAVPTPSTGRARGLSSARPSSDLGKVREEGEETEEPIKADAGVAPA